ncbi:M23 family metallopeptidase [Fundidesulfovibrio terrae]|uniref:M23 family metallopeptidase n=1 Tax=Fundidesulfovibrio terrae TaxID=2922866 RepID=UPI001FAE8C28|nr:M23 family metallopeptidase [Fundidesulfovibrio terrae]
MPDSSRFEIFKDLGNIYKPVRPKMRLVRAVLVLMCLVLAGNVWWLMATLARPSLEEELEDSLKSASMRTQALERIAAKTHEAEEGVDRLRQGDAQLREMIRLDKEARNAAQGVGDGADQKPAQQALLTRMEIRAAYVRALNRPVRMVMADAQSLTNMLAQGPSPMGAAPDAWPVRGVVSSEFGVRLSPFAGQEEFHKGVDIMAPAGSPVRAPAPGVILFAGVDAEGSQAAMLDHGGGYVTTFSHMQRLDAKTGDRLDRGDPIGAVGQEGRSTGPHLHYEVRLHGVPVDPRKYLP